MSSIPQESIQHHKAPIHWETLFVIALGILVRFLYLDADPYYYPWLGYIADEGRWNEHARNLFIAGSLFKNENILHFLIAPLFQLINYSIYYFFDISRITARIFPAVCGSLILIVFYQYFRRIATRQALFLGITFLAFVPDLIALSRMSIPEIPAMLCQLLIFLLIVSPNPNPLKMGIAGFLMIIAIGIKATMLPFIVIYALIIISMRDDSENVSYKYGRWHNLAFFMIGSGLMLIIFGLIYCVDNTHSISTNINTITQFVGLNSLYGFVVFPFDHDLSPTFNIWAIGLWITLMVWMTNGKQKQYSNDLIKLLTASFIWFLVYYVMMQSLSYFPERYKIHILIPMTVIIVVGITLLQRIGTRVVIDSAFIKNTNYQVIKIFIFTFPSSVFCSPLIGRVLADSFINTDPVRFRFKILSIILSSFILNSIAWYWGNKRNIRSFFLLFPIISALGWLTLSIFAPIDRSFWIKNNLDFYSTISAITISTALVTSIIIGQIVPKAKSSFLAPLLTIIAVFHSGVRLSYIYPAYTYPQYSIRDASVDMGHILSDFSSIASLGASSLFMDNRLPYHWFVRDEDSVSYPEIIVIAFNVKFPFIESILEKNYYPFRKYQLNVYPKSYFGSSVVDAIVYRRQIDLPK